MNDYSQIAATQLDELESTADDELWNAVLDACALALNYPAEAQKRSTAVVTTDGEVVLRLPVAGFPLYKVLWSQSTEGPRVEAVFPHP